MKTEVLRIVQAALGGAEDNLYRANMQFGKMSQEELNQEYGQSGRSCGDILLGYQSRADEIKRCLEWVNSAT
jgi:hypothetical protein